MCAIRLKFGPQYLRSALLACAPQALQEPEAWHRAAKSSKICSHFSLRRSSGWMPGWAQHGWVDQTALTV